jgi:hypothetical protein
MAKYRRTKKALRRARGTSSAWREFLLLSMFVMLLGAALTATWSSGSMSEMKGAWVAQAMR